MAHFSLPFVPLLLSIALFCASSTCKPVNSKFGPHTAEDLSTLLRRQDGIFSVLGIAGLGDSTVYPRLEIRDLERNHPDQWNVFLLGLQRFQAVSQDDKLSYFQIAGIHGRPFGSWDGVAGDPYYWSHYSGYCLHDSNLFPTWHRPYLALFEEVLHLNSRQVISDFPNGELKDRYWRALSTLRLPYWDWAAIPPAGEGTLPRSVQNATIDVVVANGTVTIPNPLHSYKFHPIPGWEAESEERWKLYPSTVRSPDSKDANAKSDNDKVAVALEKNRQNMQARVFNLLALQHDYLNISTKLRLGDSMESVHGTIHDAVGLDGSMTWLFYSAFDPVFWLHHTYVDRLLALWQALNPDSWVTSFTNPSPTFTLAANFTVDADTPLKPFHKDDSGNFWTSSSIRDHRTFSYTYPDFLNLSFNSTLIARLNTLYGPNAGPLPKLKRGIATTGAPHFSGKRQYTLDVQVQEFKYPGSLKIYAFLGPVGDADASKWVEEPGFVGVTSILAASKEGVQEANSIIPLTPALETKVRSAELESMDENDVAVFLRRNLKWKVVKANDDLTNCDTEEAPGLQISVTWQEIEPAMSVNEFPRPAGEVKELLCAAEAQKGGFWTRL